MILDGKALALEIENSLKDEIEKLKQENKRVPCLAVIQVGDNPASTSYVKSKKLACERVGIRALEYKLSENIQKEKLEETINALNHASGVDGILLQLPLPLHLQELERYFMDMIVPERDVDGFGQSSIAGLFNDTKTIVPCTPKGILRILEKYFIQTEGRHVVILGRSTIVGKPIALALLSKFKNATVTVCHSKTKNLPNIIRQADILIAAIGQPEFVQAEWVNPDCAIIDVGINRIVDVTKKSGYRLVGDVSKEAYEKVGLYTPVPGGVGPMTVAMLLENTFELYKK